MRPTSTPTHPTAWPLFTVGALLLLVFWLLPPTPAAHAQKPSAPSQPSTLLPLDGIAQVAAGDEHTCALSTGGGVKCWGDNSSGQVGDGSTQDKPTPVDVFGLGSGVTAIAAGGAHTCALTSGGGVKCWGWNFVGQLGDGSTTNSPIPVDVIGLSSAIVAIAAGGGHTCALTSAGGVKCWGWNYDGEVGDGTFGSIDGRLTPVDVVELSSGVAAISAGGFHTCALTSQAALQCWGSNEYGQMGNGTETYAVPKPTPVDPVALGSSVVAITSGDYHTCALTSAGGIKCWGRNNMGQVGDGSTENTRTTPVDVFGLGSGVSALTAGSWYTCALSTGGGVKCWGYNSSGQVGDGSRQDKPTPVDVFGLGSGVTAITAGFQHTCVLMSGGGVKCWGRNKHGQLGDGSTTDSPTPVDVMIRILNNHLFLPAVQR